jgi:hypothetical protein
LVRNLYSSLMINYVEKQDSQIRSIEKDLKDLRRNIEITEEKKQSSVINRIRHVLKNMVIPLVYFDLISMDLIILFIRNTKKSISVCSNRVKRNS